MKITIDGQKIELKEKKTILEVARDKGIFIPSLCDHPRLVPFAGCRLCIVEIKGRKGFPPACSTFVEDGMEVLTETLELQMLRRQILELILSEHPNACLICSEKEKCEEYKCTIRKAGEVTGCVLCPNNDHCQLQEVVEALKIDKIRYPSLYRNFEVRREDPFFDRNYNLCILCGRCVRICHEVRGASVLSFVFRGSKTAVGTALDRTLLESACQFCGACVDVCPTGALVEKAIRYKGIADNKLKTVCPLCSIGCELTVELRGGKILSSIPREEGVVNQGQGCLKGRFAIRDLVYSRHRILKPLIRLNTNLEETSWEEALDFVAQKLKLYKGKQIAFVDSSQVSTEENFIFQKFARKGLKSENVAHFTWFSHSGNYWQMAVDHGFELDSNFEIKEISEAKTIFVIGGDPALSEPIVWLEMLKAIKKGAKLIIASPEKVSIQRHSWHWLQIIPGTEVFLFGLLSKILLENGSAKGIFQNERYGSFKNSLSRLSSPETFSLPGIEDDDLRKISQTLLDGKPSVFLFGPGLFEPPWGRESLAALMNLALQVQAQLIPLSLENNLRGALAVLSNHSGKLLALDQIIDSVHKSHLKALYLAGPSPLLAQAQPEFLVIQDSFVNDNMKFAHAILPATTFAETEGTYVNLEGRVQKFSEVIEPVGDARPDWWIISKLAQKMGLQGFAYRGPSEIMEEMRRVVPAFQGISYQVLNKGKPLFVKGEMKEVKKFIPLDYRQLTLESSKPNPFSPISDYSLDYYRSLLLAEEIKSLKIIRDSQRAARAK